MKPIVERFPKVAKIYRGLRDQIDSMNEPQITPWGFKLAGNDAMAKGCFEPVETEVIRKILENVDVLVNVGANVGYYCCHALSMDKAVIAFEPMERNIRYLCKNIKINGWDNAEIYPIALSNQIGILEIYGGGTGASLIEGWAGIPETYKTLIPSSTMDNVIGSRLANKKVLVLIDIEGAEQWMLEGASIMLNNSVKPTWMVEIMTKDHQPAGIKINPHLKIIFQIFLEKGYQAFTADKEMRPVSIDEVDDVSKGNASFGTHNFIFR